MSGWRPGQKGRARFWALILGLVVLTGVLSASTTYAVVSHAYSSGVPAELRGVSGYWEFLRVWRILKTEYVEPVDPERMMEGAIRGLVQSLDDPYSGYMEPEHYKEMKVHTSGTYVGVGIVVEQKGDYTVVVSPFQGTPAQKAGLKPGDRIVEVDGKDVVGIPVDAVVKMIRGPRGTEVVLTVVPAGREEPREVRLTRALISIPSVEHRMLEDRIGYIRLSQFTSKTAREVRRALDALAGQGMEALVLDLRHNPGGLLDQAVEVAELFVPRGPIVHLVDREGNRTTYSSDSEGASYPLAVLVDGGSASASEIVAGAIQDRKAGVVVGSRTFGKASVQNIHDLPEGAGLRLTTARYLTPSGRAIDKVGLEPDVLVEPPGGASRERVPPGAQETPEHPPEGAGEGEADPVLQEAVRLLHERLGS